MSWRTVAGWNEHKLVELTADLLVLTFFERKLLR
jgi:hypothetical protein